MSDDITINTRKRGVCTCVEPEGWLDIVGETTLAQPVQEDNTEEARNFTCAFGEKDSKITISFTEAKTLMNRIKWWLFCEAFPVRIIKWEKG